MLTKIDENLYIDLSKVELFSCDHIDCTLVLEGCPKVMGSPPHLGVRIKAELDEYIERNRPSTDTPIENSILYIKIQDIDEFTVRVINALTHENIFTVADLISYSGRELLRIENLGVKCLREIRGWLRNNNLSLKEDS